MLETLIKLNSSRVGHDKLVRSIQYACKLISATQTNPQATKSLESTLRSARKLLRLGTAIDALYSSTLSIRHPDLVIRLTVTLSRIASAMFLFGDHLVWLHNASLVNVSLSKWSTFSNKSWLYSIILNLARDVYELQRILRCYQLTNPVKKMPNQSLQEVVESYYPILAYVLREHKNAVLDLVKNMTDVVLPLSALGYIQMPKFVGLCGVVSSLAAALQVMDPRLKL